MAIYNKISTGGNGIPYTKECDSSADYGSIANSTYFKDLSDGFIKYKTAGGLIQNIFSGDITYFAEAQTTTAPNATVYANSLTAVSSTTDADFVIKPKGTGAFIVGHIPNGAGSEGNKRGQYAIDINPAGLYYFTAVASGLRSILIGGGYSTNTDSVAIGRTSYAGGVSSICITAGGATQGATGTGSVVLGTNGQGGGLVNGSYACGLIGGSATGESSFAVGYGSATGVGAIALGGGYVASASATANYSFATNNSTIANGIYGSAFGIYSTNKTVGSRISLGSFQDVSPYLRGSSQLSMTSVTIQSSSATALEMLTYGGTAIAVPLQDNESIRVKGSIIGRASASTGTCCYDFDCVIVRGVGAATTVMLGTVSMTLIVDTIGVTTAPTLSANTGTGGLSVKSGGKAATTIRWSARIDSTESILA